ncbi:MAG TPA: DUF1552 domain-containing protein [Polyangiaceae bacterium]|nr:DUF1552 domain-containing protein [Polyangiaceae bacterium]
MFTHYGCITTKFFPVKSHGALAASDLSPSLQALSPYVAKLLIPRGIRSMNEWTQSMNRGQGNDPHTQVVGSYFTCQPVTPNSDSPFSFDNSTKFQAKPVGPSLDHVIAQALSSDGMGTPLLMRVGNQSDSPQSAISYSAATTAFPGLGTPSQAYTGLTGLFSSGSGSTTGAGSTMNADTYQAVRGKSIIDLVKDDLATLERAPMSQADIQKLEAWKALLDDTNTVMATAACNQDVANMLGATQSNINAAGMGGLGSDVLTTKVSGDLDGADIYTNVAALAAVCNANPVIVLKYPGSYVFKGLGITTESHSLSHRLDNAGMSGSCLPDAVADLIKVDQYYCSKYAYLLKQLDSMSEGDGTVLDHSATIWFSEMSDGNAHNLNNAPIIQAGSLDGYFKTGWTVNVEDGSATLSQGNSESQCADGTSDQMANGLNQGTGTDPKYANAPINKYFCNIMNAMGVKGDANGAPSRTGTGDVTHYGYSDDTTKFIHGQVTGGGGITNPGEYTALKANS